MDAPDQVIFEIVSALSKSRGVFVGGIVGGVLGFLFGVLVLGYGAWMLKKGWPELGRPVFRDRIRIVMGLVWFFVIPSGLSTLGTIIGAGLGALQTIENETVVEDATIVGLADLGPSIYGHIAGLPETSDQFPIVDLSEGIKGLKEDFYTAMQSVIAEKTEDKKLVGSFAGFCLNWLAKAKLDEFAAYGNDVVADLRNKAQLSPTADQISASIGAVHIKPVARDGVMRMTRLYAIFSSVPLVVFAIAPVLGVNWWVKRKAKS